MKILLTAINTKYIHSNLGIYSLRAYAVHRMKKVYGSREVCNIEIGEYTINHQMDLILQDIYKRKPEVIGFSCYIWNIMYVRQLIHDLPKVLPGVNIWLGGPEVSYCAEEILRQEPAVQGVMVGEGEAVFAQLVEYCIESMPGTADFYRKLESLRGFAYRDASGVLKAAAPGPLLSMDEIPFPYESLEGLEHRILYYESSRGCPYSCSYCLSSIDKTVRFRSPELVKKELDFFLEHQVPQVKFVDRTFNCNKSHALAIWNYILEHDNGVTNFHFEISADLLEKEELALMKKMRPGLIQLEIGVQTTSQRTIREIHRRMDLEKLREAVYQIRSGRNIHQHLDLIAGLPYESFERFRKSFDEVYMMRPDQLQLGFLKLLTGSHMAEKVKEYGILYHEGPPYEVISTNWLDYGQILRLKAVEEMVEVYYNSGQFQAVLGEMEKLWASPYAMFEELAGYYEKKRLTGLSHSRMARYEILFDFLTERDPGHLERYRDLLMYDLYLRENVKSRPSFARDLTPFKKQIREFFQKEEIIRQGAHIEVMGDGKMVLFDYRKRDPLSHNAMAVILGEKAMQKKDSPD